jgi:2-polyprenyl-3-methyl-5-hydroxy-6-metoxy-1,4-benzoquinol methylase
MNGPASAAGARFHEQLASSWTNAYENGSFNRRLHFFLPHLDRLVQNDSVWLDAGCGSGVLARELAARGARVIGMDGSPAMIAHAAATESPGIRIDYKVISTIEQLPLGSSTINGILCSSVLEYADDPVATLREFHRVLVPAGTVLVTVPNFFSVIRIAQSLARCVGCTLGRSWFPYLAVSRHAYSALVYRTLLEKAGFEVTRIEPFSPFIPHLLAPLQLSALWLAVARKTAA